MGDGYSVYAVGESKYGSALKRICGPATSEANYIKTTATLILEDENPYDPGNAVRVDVNGSTVAYLSRDDAKEYRGRGLVSARTFCPALLIALRSGRTAGDYGVRLDLESVTEDVQIDEIEKPPVADVSPESQHHDRTLVSLSPVPARRRSTFARIAIIGAVLFVGFFAFRLVQVGIALATAEGEDVPPSISTRPKAIVASVIPATPTTEAVDGTTIASNERARNVSPSTRPELRFYLDRDTMTFHAAECPDVDAKRMMKSIKAAATLQGFAAHSCVRVERR